MVWKMATFNVNGIRARLPIVLDWLQKEAPDVLCLQEIKCQEKGFPFKAFEAAGYQAAVRGQKSFNGVALLFRDAPEEIRSETGRDVIDREARFLAALMNGVWVVNTYVPQGRSPDDPAFQFKLSFLKELKSWFENHFDPGDRLIWTGDINVAPEPLDVFDPKRLEGEVGFHPEERAVLADVTAWGLEDVFRKIHPEVRQFTFWDYRLPKSFERNLGWRLDHVFATRVLAEAAVDCGVDVEPRGREKPSDHTPVWAVFNLSG